MKEHEIPCELCGEVYDLDELIPFDDRSSARSVWRMKPPSAPAAASGSGSLTTPVSPSGSTVSTTVPSATASSWSRIP